MQEVLGIFMSEGIRVQGLGQDSRRLREVFSSTFTEEVNFDSSWTFKDSDYYKGMEHPTDFEQPERANFDSQSGLGQGTGDAV